MIYGDQWICKCGMHNFIMRRKCRAAGCNETRPQKLTKENYESVETIIEKKSNESRFS